MKRNPTAGLDARRRKPAGNTLGFISEPPIGPDLLVKNECRAFRLRLGLVHQRIARSVCHWVSPVLMETPRWARCATALFQLPPKALRMQSAPTRCALARRNSIVFSAFRIMFSAKYAAGAACPGAFVSAITLLLDFCSADRF
jgi:hypothetical protein